MLIRTKKRILTYNVLQIPEGGDYEAQNLIQQQMFNRSTTLDNTTKAPLLGMCCYKPFFFTNLK
jgi:hypothetical protein